MHRLWGLQSQLPVHFGVLLNLRLQPEQAADEFTLSVYCSVNAVFVAIGVSAEHGLLRTVFCGCPG